MKLLVLLPGLFRGKNCMVYNGEDSKLPSNSRKNHKLNYREMHPGSNKQRVNLAQAVFDETTIAAIRCYLPARKDTSGFLIPMSKW